MKENKLDGEKRVITQSKKMRGVLVIVLALTGLLFVRLVYRIGGPDISANIIGVNSGDDRRNDLNEQNSAGEQAKKWLSAKIRARKVVATMRREEKEAGVAGVGWAKGPCVGNVAPLPGLKQGLCLQDAPMGVRLAPNVSAFPSALNAAASFDKRLMYKYGALLGAEFRALGVHVALGPMTNLIRVPAGGRNWEGPGADPFLASVQAAAMVRGIQSQGVIATVKHLIANEQEHYRFDYSSNLDKRTLMEVYFAPFEACVRAGVAAVMCSYNRLNQIYTCAHDELINGILKGPDINFQGFVMTDWGAHYSFVASDMVMAGEDASKSVDGLTAKDIPENRLDDMVTRILSAHYVLGQDEGFPNVQFNSWEQKEKNVYNFDYRFKQHASFIRELGAASTVLLKNSKKILPLSEGSSVAVIGEDARRPNILNEFDDRGGNDGTLAQGWGSGTSEFPYLISPLEAISSRAAVISSTDNYDLNSAKNAASSASFAIVFANSDSGEARLVEGHEGDRNDLKLWHKSDALITAVASANQNTIVVLHTVGAVDMPWINHPNISAVVLALLPGQESGAALASVLFGDVNPSARLPFTIHESRRNYAADVLYDSNQEIPQITYSEGLYFDYRHADKFNITPVFSFGHGLSYSTFTYSRLTVTRVHTNDEQSAVSVKLRVKNNDFALDGHEVVQVYVAFPEAADEPPKLLKGFERVWIRRGKAADVEIVVEAKDLRVWGVGGWTFVKGSYKFLVGASSTDIRLQKEFLWR